MQSDRHPIETAEHMTPEMLAADPSEVPERFRGAILRRRDGYGYECYELVRDGETVGWMLDDGAGYEYGDQEPEPTPHAGAVFTARATLRTAWNQDADATADVICERYNCATAEVDEAGDVWIEGPQRGHWLADDELVNLVSWARKSHGWIA